MLLIFLNDSQTYVANELAIVSSGRKQTTGGRGESLEFDSSNPEKWRLSPGPSTLVGVLGPSGVLTVSFFALTACQNPA
jgi:hypothetical protein